MVASIGFLNGEAAGSATPLTWAQAQLARLLVGLAEDRSIEQPADVRERYVDNPPPAAVPVTITAPADGSLVSTPTVSVTGATEPGATVDVSAFAGDADGATTTATTTAGADGMYAAEVPTPFGTNYITVAATTDEGTGRARVVVVSDFIEGTVCSTSPTLLVTTTGRGPTPTRRAPTSTTVRSTSSASPSSTPASGWFCAPRSRPHADVRQPTRRAAARHLRA